MIRLWIPGIPAPKGSTRAFMRPGMKHPVVIADNTKTRPWEQAIRAEAARAGVTMTDEPLRIVATFHFHRPKGHYTPKGVLRSSAPHHHTKKPDLDKLARALLDGLIGVAMRDDAQVVALDVRKRFISDMTQPGAEVLVDHICCWEQRRADGPDLCERHRAL